MSGGRVPPAHSPTCFFVQSSQAEATDVEPLESGLIAVCLRFLSSRMGKKRLTLDISRAVEEASFCVLRPRSHSHLGEEAFQRHVPAHRWLA